ncbi:hypothetical protein SOVF_082340, partial [Spinacia oleracea]
RSSTSCSLATPVRRISRNRNVVVEDGNKAKTKQKCFYAFSVSSLFARSIYNQTQMKQNLV